MRCRRRVSRQQGRRELSSCFAGEQPSKLEGQIEFRNIKFAYPSRPDELVFDNFNLTIPAGKTVAFVGERYLLQ